MHDALWTVRENFPSLGDVNRMKNDKLMGSEFASEELKNAIQILVLLGENLDKWCPDCDLKRQTEYVPEDPQDVAEPGQLQEKRRRLKKKRFKLFHVRKFITISFIVDCFRTSHFIILLLMV